MKNQAGLLKLQPEAPSAPVQETKAASLPERHEQQKVQKVTEVKSGTTSLKQDASGLAQAPVKKQGEPADDNMVLQLSDSLAGADDMTRARIGPIG